MAGIFPMGDLVIDQKKGQSGLNNAAAESWLEPLLLKSSFYRKHFTHNGRRESKSTLRGTSIEDDILERRASMAASASASISAAASRKSSLAMSMASAADATASTAKPEPGPTTQ